MNYCYQFFLFRQSWLLISTTAFDSIESVAWIYYLVFLYKQSVYTRSAAGLNAFVMFCEHKYECKEFLCLNDTIAILLGTYS